MKISNLENKELALEQEIVGSMIRRLREGRELDQGDVARFAGLTQSQLSRIENGKAMPNLSTLKRLIEVTAAPGRALEIWTRLFEELIPNHDKDLDVENLDLASLKNEAQSCLQNGDYLTASRYIAALETKAQKTIEIGESQKSEKDIKKGEKFLRRALIYLACYAKDVGRDKWSQELFSRALEYLDDEDDDGINDTNMYYINLAELHIDSGNRGRISLVKGMIQTVITRNSEAKDPRNGLFKGWGIFINGRVHLHEGNIREGIHLIEEAISILSSFTGKTDQYSPENYIGWFKSYLGKALCLTEDRKDEGLGILKDLLKKWGPVDEPKDAEIFARASLDYGITIDDPDHIKTAEIIAEKMGYTDIRIKARSIRTKQDKKGV